MQEVHAIAAAFAMATAAIACRFGKVTQEFKAIRRHSP
jgi:hypothetical protein